MSAQHQVPYQCQQQSLPAAQLALQAVASSNMYPATAGHTPRRAPNPASGSQRALAAVTVTHHSPHGRSAESCTSQPRVPAAGHLPPSAACCHSGPPL